MNVDDIDDIDDLNDELDINVDSLSLASKKKDESKDKIKVDEISKEKKEEEDKDYGGFDEGNIQSQEQSLHQTNKESNKELEQKVEESPKEEEKKEEEKKDEPIDDSFLDKIINESKKKQDTITSKKQSEEKSISKLSSKHISDVESHGTKDFSEASYYVLKTELENILAKDTFNSPEEIAKQNEEMIFYLKKLNDTLTLIVNNSTSEIEKVETPLSPDEQKKKLVEVYKREYLRLETRLKQLTDPSYEENLNKSLSNLNLEIAKIENENKTLKISQKQSEILIDRQSQNVNKAEIELKRLQMDYENIINQQKLLSEKINKENNVMKDNDEKIKQLNEWQEKLEKIAKEMYDIKEYENVKDEEEKEKSLNEKKNSLIKKYEVYQKVLKSNNKKYEIEIAKNEKIIFNLEKSKTEVLEKFKKVVGEDYYADKTNNKNRLNVNNQNNNGDNVSFGLSDNEKDNKKEVQ